LAPPEFLREKKGRGGEREREERKGRGEGGVRDREEGKGRGEVGRKVTEVRVS
jgi:hypothetical protein